MSELLTRPPFGSRDDELFAREMHELTRWHLQHCEEFMRVWPDWQANKHVEELPYLHVGLFKHLLLKTKGPKVRHERELHSSSTSGQNPSRVALDSESSTLQAHSSRAILTALVGEAKRPLLVLDSARSLRRRDSVSARVMAAMSLRPMASQILFLMKDPEDPSTLDWQAVERCLGDNDQVLVYGFTWALWTAWAQAEMPNAVARRLASSRVHFVHSGGWKKLEAVQVLRERFNATLLERVADGSAVLDYYGLVEQVGVIYPLCSAGFRHVPAWARVVVRDPFTLEALGPGQSGQLQLMNTLPRGAPYHNVLTEDVGRLVPDGPCDCGLDGQRFILEGRVPKAEVRGCANT